MTDILIPIFQDRISEHFESCLKSIFAHTKDFNLILVTSSDSQPINLNRGLQAAHNKYVAILDWDVIVPARWLKILTKNLDDDMGLGIIGAKMTGAYVGQNRLAELGVQEWPTLAGGCLVFRNIGIKWDEKFPSGYWADTDFCRAFKTAGYKVAINGDVEVEHFPTTFGNHKKQVLDWSDIGAEIYKEKWGDNEF